MANLQCRYFSGYKPCERHKDCDENCPKQDRPRTYLLVVHLEALGAVLRATSLLPAIKRKFPQSHVTWVTQAPAQAFFENNPLVDRVLTTRPDDLLALSCLEFDVGMVVDKSLKAAGVLRQTQCDVVFGFQVNPRGGAIQPSTSAAEELWELGLSNHRKFFVNRKPETQLMAEALELGAFQRDEYQVFLSQSEKELLGRRRHQWKKQDGPLIGINTGCSGVIPYKKLSLERHYQLISLIQESLTANVVLLGGPEDTARNQEIARHFPFVSLSPTEEGLRDGLVSVAACDLVVSGDSLGLHMAIAMKKWAIAWFGPTCAHEIDLYDRGVHILSPLSCSPCWKRNCRKSVMCNETFPVQEIFSKIRSFLSEDRESRHSWVSGSQSSCPEL